MIDLVQLATAMTGDEAGRLTETDANRAVLLALLRYSSDRPRQARSACLVQSDGRTLALPATWEPGQSRIVSIFYPAGDCAGQAALQLLPADAWLQHETPNGEAITLLYGSQAGDVAYVHYTASHTAATVPPADLESVAHWAAALMLDQLASLYSGDKQSTIEADAVDHQGKGGSYAARAAEHRKLYLDHLGIDPKRTVAAGTVLTIGGGGLLHGRPRKRPIR